MNNFTPAQIEMVLTRLGLVFQDKGNHYLMRSPLRGDNNPDFWVYKSGYCVDYAGTFRGSLSSFFFKMTGRSLRAAMPELGIMDQAAAAWIRPRINVQSTETVKRGIVVEEASIVSVYDDAEAYRYCQSRHITDALIESLSITYARRARIRGASAEGAGTLVNKRILIPILEKDEVWSVECRDVTRSQEKKVIYPRGCSVNTLFDVDKLDRSKPLVIVEGLMDLFSVRRVLANSTCTFGIGVTPRQMKLINEFEKVILLPDSDKGGDAFIETLSEQYIHELLIAHVPEKDPGDSTTENIRQAIETAQPWIVKAIDGSGLFTREALIW